MKADHVFEDFSGIDLDNHKLLKATNFPLPRNFDCLKAMVTAYDTFCTKMDDYSL